MVPDASLTTLLRNRSRGLLELDARQGAHCDSAESLADKQSNGRDCGKEGAGHVMRLLKGVSSLVGGLRSCLAGVPGS